MATLQTLGVDSLSLRGAGTEYNSLSRVFKTKAEADAALASGDWTPVPGRMNLCVTGDQGVLRVDENGVLVNADAATRAYIDAEITRIVGDAPAVLDSLGELSDAISDDPDFFATMASANTTLQEAINTEVSRATAAEQAIQNDVDANEQAAADAAAAELARATAAEAAIQADVDQNEADADAAIAAEEARALAAEAAIQADVDANEASANAGIAAEAARAGAAEAAIQADVDQNEADADAAIAVERARIDAILLSADADKDSFAEIVTLINSVDTANDNAFAAYVLSNDAAVAAVQADVDQNEADIEDKVSDVNNALGISVGDTSFSFTEDLIVVELDQSRATDHVGIYTDVTTAGPDAAQSLNLKTALERLAANSRIILAAEKFRMDAEDARLDAVIGSTGSDLGTFTGSIIADNTDVRGALQSLETATETEISDRQAAIADILDGATFTGDILFGSLARLKESGNEFKIQNDAQSSSIVLGPKISLQPATGSRIELHETVRMPDGTDLTVTGAELNFVDGVTSSIQDQLDAIQSDVDQNESDADTAIALKADIASPAFTGTPTAPTAAAATNTTQLATTAFVTTAVANLINSAPGALDTLNELASALGNDANFATTVTDSIAAVQADVDQNELDADNAIATKLNASAVSAFGLTLVDDADAATARTTLGLGTAATTDATAYATAAQGATADAALAASAVSAFGLTLVDDADAAAARTTLGVDAAGTDNSTDVTLAAGLDYLTISGQEITLGSVDLTTDVTGALPVANGGTGATDAAGARTALGLGSAATTDSTDYATAAQGATADAALPAAGAQAALSVDHLITLSGVAEAADDLGTFTGSTISDSGTVKAALQELETALETKAPDADLTTLETTVGNISGGVTSTTYAFDSGTSAEPGSKDIRFNNTTPANVTEIYISKTNKAGVDLSNVIPEMLFAGVRIYIQNEGDASQYLAATITSVTEVNATYTLGVNEVSAGSLISNNAKTAFAVIGKTPLDLGTFTGSTIADNATPKEALQSLETAVELRALLDGTNIPGPYADDAAAASGGVAVGALYKHNNGQIHWRVS